MIKCAWCLPKEEERKEGQSHGICEDHKEQMKLQRNWNKLEKVPSYVERLKEERHFTTFWETK